MPLSGAAVTCITIRLRFKSFYAMVYSKVIGAVMRIAIFTECYVPEINGVVYHIETLRRGLIEAGHAVLIVKSDFKTRRHYIEDDILYSPAVKLRNLYDYSISYPYSKTRLRLLKEWAPDVIHIHTECSQGIFALYAARKLQIPVVYTIHTMYYDYLHYFGRLQNLRALKKVVNWTILRYTNAAKAVICASVKMEEFLQLCGVTTSIYKIPNACISGDFSEQMLDKDMLQNLKDKYHIRPTDFNLCFCGRIAEEKNLSVMLDYWKTIVADMPCGRLFIIGDGRSRVGLEQKAKELGLEQSVLFTGKVPHELIKYYYHLCDAYFMTSLSENHSVSALEAIACGLPIVHMYDKTNEDQYIEGLTGFAFTETDTLLTILRTIYEGNHGGAKKRLKNEVITATTKDDYRAMTGKICEVYEQVIAERTKG